MHGKCRIDGAELEEVFDLGAPCVSAFVDDPSEGVPFPMKLGIGPTSGLVQLYEGYPPTEMYAKYWYLSSINESMKVALQDVVSSSRPWVSVGAGDVVLDIGCNDGTLLSCWPQEVTRFGIDPAKNLAPLSSRHATAVASDFFSADVFRSLAGSKKAKVITSIAMFYDLDDPHAFVEHIKASLAPNGVWILELAYTPLMLQQNAFDVICHEHLCYYTLQVMERLLDAHGMKILDVRLNNINGGSFRIHATRQDARSEAPLYDADIGDYRKKSYLERESHLDLSSQATYQAFFRRVEGQKQKTLNFLKNAKERGELVLGYGASTKGNTLLQFYGITPELLPAIADRSEAKHGKFTVGSKIPIISEDAMRARRPRYLLALPWHFIPGFVRREEELIRAGTQFVVPLPEFEIVGQPPFSFE